MEFNTFNQGVVRMRIKPKILLIMKLIVVMITTCFMQVSASTFGQYITMSKKNASIQEVLKIVKQQSGYDVLYKDEVLANTKKVSLSLVNVPLADALDKILENQLLTYTIREKTIVIKPKDPTFLDRVVATLVGIDVSGRIVDADGRGLPGASVSVKGKGKSVSTGANGSFYLKGVDEDAVLVISFIGYVAKEVKAAKELGDVVLEQSLSKLDEVQVIAYGTTTQRLSTGNVTTIKADVIEKQPVNNPLLALQGRVPGLFIEQATGFAGTGVKVRIQGTNSMANGNDPLYLIDGIPFTSQLLDGASSILGTSGNLSAGNPLNYINPADIESIDVLKDADATSIYGSRAANGAILITTKKGKPGEIKADINIQSGWGKVPRKLDLMNSEQYLEMRREALKNDGITAFRSNDYDLNGNWNNTRYTDWQKDLIGGSAMYNDIQGSISGGNNSVTFLTGAAYHKEGNVFPGDFTDSKGSVHFNINSASFDNRFKMQFSGSYLHDNNLLPNIDLTRSAMTLAPVAPNLYNSGGGINWQPNSSGTSTFYNNPISYLYQKSKNITDNLVGNGVISYEIIPGLDISSSFGYNKLDVNTILTLPVSAIRPEYMKTARRKTTFGNSNVDSWSLEPLISYNRTILNGKLDLLVGTTIQKENRGQSSVDASGFSTDQVMENISSATTLSAGSSFNSIYKYNAIFGRINYNQRNKYILNLTARRDGSSRFGPENQFHNFGAVGLAWIFSEEKLVKNDLSFLSFGKLRGSYGTTGSDQISDYRFLSLYSSINGITAPWQGANSYRPSGLSNPYLQWEETKKLQIGLDLGFFNNKVLFNTNYFLNRSSNQLLAYPLPLITGFYEITKNLPATLENSGWEFSLSTTNLELRNFKWTSSINLTIPRNKLIRFPDLDNSSYASYYEIGQSVNIQKIFKFLDVDPATGVYRFKDHNGNPTFNPIPIGYPDNDATATINPDPKFYGGFQNTFIYKNFQVDILFQFTKQIGQNYFLGSPGVSGLLGTGNEPVSMLNRWQKPGDIASYEKYGNGIGFDGYFALNYATTSDLVWSDASYVRLKNLSISWQIPQTWKRYAHIKNCKLYVQGQNLLTVTNYLGLDPESKSSMSLPPLRVITFGIQIGL